MNNKGNCSRNLLSMYFALPHQNADCVYVSSTKWAGISLKTDTNYKWWIGDDADTTVKHTHCAYDRYVIVRVHV